MHLEVAFQAGKLCLQLLPLRGCVRELKCRLLLDEGELLEQERYAVCCEGQVLVGNGVDFFLKECSSTEDQGAGLCIVDLKFVVKNIFELP